MGMLRPATAYDRGRYHPGNPWNQYEQEVNESFTRMNLNVRNEGWRENLGARRTGIGIKPSWEELRPLVGKVSSKGKRDTCLNLKNVPDEEFALYQSHDYKIPAQQSYNHFAFNDVADYSIPARVIDSSLADRPMTDFTPGVILRLFEELVGRTHGDLSKELEKYISST